MFQRASRRVTAAISGKRRRGGICLIRQRAALEGEEVTRDELEKELQKFLTMADSLRCELHRVQKRCGELSLAINRLRFNCPCVRLNREIRIFDSGNQFDLGRVGLSMGIVGDTFSAEKRCPICHGTGEAK